MPMRQEPPERTTELARAPRVPELDEATLVAAQRGERAACRAFVQRYQQAVFALLGRLLGPRQTLIEDLAQETFLRAFSALPRFDLRGPARVSTWILTIAGRIAVDELRRVQPPFEPLSAIDDRPAATRADEQTRRRRLARAIEAALASLSPEYRVAFVLRELHELEYPEIAAALGIDRGTVKSRLSRARAALREALAAYETEQP